MFFQSDVLSYMLKKHTRINKFESNAESIFRYGDDYCLENVSFSTVGPNGSIVYGFTFGEEHNVIGVKRWVRIDYDTLTVNQTFNSGYSMTENFTNYSVLNNEKLMSMGFSNHELQLLATLVQHVKIRGANVLQN